VESKSRIVDQKIDRLAGGLDVGDECVRSAVAAEIDLDRSRIAELGGEMVESVLAPRREDEPVAASRKLARELRAEPS